MFYYFILYFAFYSFVGWVGEVCYAYKNQKALHVEDLKTYQDEFIKKDLDCFF